MGKKLERVLELVESLREARAVVAGYETELAELLGENVGGGEPVADRRALIAARATGVSKKGPKPSEERERAVAMAKEGKSHAEIVAALGVPAKTLSNYLFRARKAGEIPKARGRE